ncbi:cyclase [Desulfoluna limicola]|uniref:Cyclase n=1 Tax=Desulfoluna limicola TaxID=2810562 RepID=A0ABN6FD27_9BACT|nr:START domain-containing protein [Desulfoluna limicola]BCS99028.1 cyclase [Desulfoluna limicola]
MKKLPIQIFFVLGLFVSATGLMAAETGGETWTKVRDRNGIVVYNRSIPDIAFKEFKAEVTLKATLSTVVAVINDIDAGVDWVENVDEMRLLERVSELEHYTYTYSKAPWPVSDRDAVVHNQTHQDPRSLVVTIDQQSVPDKIPHKKGIVRVPSIEAEWGLIPMGPEETRIVYRVLSDPGGRIPSWLVNTVSVSQPYNTMRGLREMAGEKKYQVDLDYIQNR